MYLALGDSLAFGVGASDPSRTAYVPTFADEIDGRGRRQTEVINLGAQFGETSTRFVQNGQLAAALGALARNDNRRRSDDVNVITLDIGGNDVAALAVPCGGGPTPACIAAVQTTLGGFAVNLELALAQLREAAGPGPGSS